MCVEANNQINDIPEEPVNLKEVYPMPRYSIKDAVMAQIAAERAAAGKQKTEKTEEPKILTFREKLTQNRSKITKWGSIAACAVFLMGVLTIAGPVMENANDSAEQSRGTENTGFAAPASENAKYTADTANPESGEMVCYSTYSHKSYDVNDEEEMAYDYSADRVTENATGSAMQAATEAAMQAATEAVLPEAETYEETVFVTDTAKYIKELVSEQISPAEYSEWLTDNRYTDVSDYSLAELVSCFAISRADLTVMLGEYADMVDMDVLYSEATDAVVTDDMIIE